LERVGSNRNALESSSLRIRAAEKNEFDRDRGGRQGGDCLDEGWVGFPFVDRVEEYDERMRQA
jgi:hypothetical protein